MTTEINVNQIHDKRLNFLIGSGASSGLFPTLGLSIQDAFGNSHTIETLATDFESKSDRQRKTALFMHYFLSCIQPVLKFTPQSVHGKPKEAEVLQNYAEFLRTILAILGRKKDASRVANIFTTNYDGCIPFVADSLLRAGGQEFLVNDGSRGFLQRILHTRHFNSFVCQTGIFEKSQVGIPQLNFIQAHGSAYWTKVGQSIAVDYKNPPAGPLLTASTQKKIAAFRRILADATKLDSDLPSPNLTSKEMADFWKNYDALPIVNPTKWKFHETVFDENYYQMLRMLSYELERPNSILICFGFSFADEHILNLVKRALSNPSLMVYVCCYSDKTATELGRHFSAYQSVKLISPTAGSSLNFTYFNDEVFSLKDVGNSAV